MALPEDGPADTTRPRSGRRRLGASAVLLLGFGLTIAAAVAISSAVFAYLSYRNHLATRMSEIGAQTAVVAEHTAQIMAAATTALDAIVDDVDRFDLASPADFKSKMNGWLVHLQLVDRLKFLPQVMAAALVALDATPVNSSLDLPEMGIPEPERELVRQLVRDPNAGLNISRVLRSGVDGSWTFYVAKVIFSSAGKPVGIAAIAVDPLYISNAYINIGAGGDQATGLFRVEGDLLTRSPWTVGALGRSVMTDPMFAAARDRPGGITYITNRERLVPGDPSPLERIVARRPVPGLPLVVAVIMPMAAAMADWYRQFEVGLAIVVIVAAVVIWATILIYRLQRQREAMEAQEERFLRELIAAKAAAEEASRAKSLFMASMSHELRTPLNAIVGYTQILQLDADQFGPEQQERLREIEDSGNILAAMFDDILEFSRLESGKVRLHPALCSPSSILARAAAIARPQAGASPLGLSLSYRVASAVPAQVTVDPDRMVQILANLASNAIKYNKRGGLVEFVADVEGDRLRFGVRDTGVGIPPSKWLHMFEPFQRLGAETGPIPGTGIGLVIARRIARAMGGDIDFSSAEGVGSFFWVWLRRSDVAKPEADDPGAAV